MFSLHCKRKLKLWNTYIIFITFRCIHSFSNFFCMFLNPNNFFQHDSNCSNLLDMRNLQEQVKKAFYYQKLFWPFNLWINWLRKTFEIRGWRPRICKFFEITRTIYSSSERSEIVLVIVECFFNLFLEVSHI